MTNTGSKASSRSERRRASRRKIETVTYVNVGTENGGILSNISEGGLCFHAACPVQEMERLHVWFSVKGRRVEADVAVVWTDETQKTGGFQFICLSPEAREQIRSICGTTEPFAAQRAVAQPEPKPKPPAFRATAATQLKRNDAAGLERVSANSSTRNKKTASGFFQGVLTCLLIAFLIVLLNLYRRQVGELIIQIGQQLASRPVQTVIPPPTRRSGP